MYLKIISTHHLKGYCESRYGEVATLGEQFRPWDRHRQVLEKDLVLSLSWIIGKKKPFLWITGKKHLLFSTTPEYIRRQTQRAGPPPR